MDELDAILKEAGVNPELCKAHVLPLGMITEWQRGKMSRADLVDELKNLAASMRKFAAETETSPWISVDERLPDIDEHVLVMWSEWGHAISYRVKINYGPGFFWCSPDSDDPVTGIVTHWMPLPPPPTAPTCPSTPAGCACG